MEHQINTLHAALCDKMQAELDSYVMNLLEEPPQVILSNAWEYATLADIMRCVANTEYTDLQMKALLESEHPLMDVYNWWSSLETDVMEQLGFCVENVANAAWRDSYRKNVACKKAIEKAIADNYHDNHLDVSCVEQVVSEFGYERVFLVLATTVRAKTWDARFSDDNKAWAGNYPVYEASDLTGADKTRHFIVDKAHPGLTDIFLRLSRKSFIESCAKNKKMQGELLC